VVDSDVDGEVPEQALVVPLVRIAREHTGKPIGAGVASLGSVAALAPGITLADLNTAVQQRLPGRLAESNLAALAAAYESTVEEMGASA
jgi:Pyruvate/2-oxoacid:ferredoxin oxidoreductase gamma subunit